MRRIFISGTALLLCGAITARSLPAPAGPVALAGKSDPLVFVFLRVDRAQDVAILRPMIAPDIGVQLDSGERKLNPGTVLRCEASVREHDAIVETKIAKVTDLVLDCLPVGEAGGDRKFIVKSLDFSPRAK